MRRYLEEEDFAVVHKILEDYQGLYDQEGFECFLSNFKPKDREVIRQIERDVRAEKEEC